MWHCFESFGPGQYSSVCYNHTRNLDGVGYISFYKLAVPRRISRENIRRNCLNRSRWWCTKALHVEITWNIRMNRYGMYFSARRPFNTANWWAYACIASLIWYPTWLACLHMYGSESQHSMEALSDHFNAPYESQTTIVQSESVEMIRWVFCACVVCVCVQKWEVSD